MKIEYLKEFLTLAEYRNYAVAADMLFISQSTLTRHIQSLEEFYQVTLFKRNTRSIEITKEGKMLIPYAREIIKTYDEFVNELEQRTIGNNYKPYSSTVVNSEHYLNFVDG